MSGLTKKDVLHVAGLAKLRLSPKQVETYLKQLSGVVEYVSSLGKIDTEGVEPTAQTTGLKNVKRPDGQDPSRCLSAPEALSQTDKTHNGYFVTGAVFGERDAE